MIVFILFSAHCTLQWCFDRICNNGFFSYFGQCFEESYISIWFTINRNNPYPALFFLSQFLKVENLEAIVFCADFTNQISFFVLKKPDLKK